MSRAVKRLIDVFVSAALLLILAPLLAAIALAVRWNMGHPVLFRQVRPGRREKPFVLRKFRTMRDAVGPDGRPLPDPDRLTTLGRFLRRSSLDELPQLWNVLAGDMSLVGPRPLLTEYLPYFSDRERLRFEVCPGITGWAQVNGRNFTHWDRRLEHDAWYVENWSNLLDFKILAMTAAVVVLGRGVVVDSTSVMTNLSDERRAGSQPGEALCRG